MSWCHENLNEFQIRYPKFHQYGEYHRRTMDHWGVFALTWEFTLRLQSTAIEEGAHFSIKNLIRNKKIYLHRSIDIFRKVFDNRQINWKRKRESTSTLASLKLTEIRNGYEVFVKNCEELLKSESQQKIMEELQLANGYVVEEVKESINQSQEHCFLSASRFRI